MVIELPTPATYEHQGQQKKLSANRRFHSCLSTYHQIRIIIAIRGKSRHSVLKVRGGLTV